MSRLRSSAGTGHLELHVDECPHCAGTGHVKFQYLTADCPACDGVGRYTGEERPLCANCNGTGQLLEGGRCRVCSGDGFHEGALSLRHILLASPAFGALAWFYALAEGFTVPAAPFFMLIGALFVGGVSLQVRHLRRRRRLTSPSKPKRRLEGP